MPTSDSDPRRTLRIADDSEAGGRDIVYIGAGNQLDRRQQSRWREPQHLAKDGVHRHVEYAKWLTNEPRLLEQVEDLSGMALLCDCALGQNCHGDVLAAEADIPQLDAAWRRKPLVRAHAAKGGTIKKAVVAAVLATAAGFQAPAEVPCRFPEYSVQRAVAKIFPEEYTAGIQWPILQDLLLDESLCNYQEYLEATGYDADLPLGPALLLDES